MSETEHNPHGRGNKLGARAGLVEADPGDGRMVLRSSWRPLPKQAPVLHGLAGIDICIAGVGGGKTQVASFVTLRWALEHPRRRDGSPSVGLIIGPDLNETRNVQMQAFLQRCRELDVPYEAVVQRVVWGQDPKIILWNGVTLFGRSGTDPERLRGYELDYFWMDEAALQVEAAFGLALNRQRSAEAIRGIVTSSPKPGWLWRVISGEDPAYNELRRHVPVRVHRWASSENATNQGDVLAAIAAAGEAYAPGMSKQELEGLFIGTSEAPGSGAIAFERAFVGRVTLKRDECVPAVLGVDLGLSGDFTWLTVLSSAGVVLAMHRFNATTVDVPRDRFYPYVEDVIAQLLERWRIPLVKIDEAMHGQSFAQALRKRLGSRARVDGYRTDSRRRKADAIEALGVGIGRGVVRVPAEWTAGGPAHPVLPAERTAGGPAHPVQFVEELRLELKTLQVDNTGLFRTFDHPPGGHDDGVVSLALAYQGISTSRPELRRIAAGWSTPGAGGYQFGLGGLTFGG